MSTTDDGRFTLDVKAIWGTLNDCRRVIDGEWNCNTPEYRALDLLHQVVAQLADAMIEARNARQEPTKP